jgi:hypothetical protein
MSKGHKPTELANKKFQKFHPQTVLRVESNSYALSLGDA